MVIRSMPRSACVIQITPVRLTRTTANDASVVRKIYLSIDPIVIARSHLARRTGGSRPIPDGIPFGRAAMVQADLHSHYHPIDPSTKWLGHGTLAIRLINRVMWRCGHGDAWQSGSGRAIVCRSKLLTDVYRNREEKNHSPAAPAPATALIL